jgi:hypothetical protein
MSSPQYYNIQKPEEGVGFVAYSGKTSMSAAAANAATGAKSTVYNEEPLVKEGFDLVDLKNRLVGDPKYDMSTNLLNFPQGHPMYVPQTLADTYSSDSKSLMDMEEMVMGFALLGGVSIMVVGILLSQGIVGPTAAAASSS